jgi:hypothetical protein
MLCDVEFHDDRSKVVVHGGELGGLQCMDDLNID